MSVRIGIGIGPFDGTAASRRSGSSTTSSASRSSATTRSGCRTRPRCAGPAPLVALAAVAARTTRLKLGTSVLVAPARNPVLLAKELATVDALSAGGCCLPSASASTPSPRRAAIGVPRAERAARTEEAIEIVRLLWAASRSRTRAGSRPSRTSRLSPRADAALARHLARRLEPGRAAAHGQARRRLARLVRLPRRARRVRRADRRGGDRGRAGDRRRPLRDDAVRRAVPVRAHARGAHRCSGGARGLALEDHVAIGAPPLHELIGRFLEAGRLQVRRHPDRGGRARVARGDPRRGRRARSSRSPKSPTSTPTAKERA